jgi:AraC-like DNA-binding protein
MQRRLGKLGTTYQDVLVGARQRSARRLLANTELAMGEIAFLLGFEEVNSFVRAFQAWEGMTPAKWRAEAAPRSVTVARDDRVHRGRVPG